MVGFKLHLEREILLQKKILVKLIFFFREVGNQREKKMKLMAQYGKPHSMARTILMWTQAGSTVGCELHYSSKDTGRMEEGEPGQARKATRGPRAWKTQKESRLGLELREAQWRERLEASQWPSRCLGTCGSGYNTQSESEKSMVWWLHLWEKWSWEQGLLQEPSFLGNLLFCSSSGT